MFLPETCTEVLIELEKLTTRFPGRCFYCDSNSLQRFWEPYPYCEGSYKVLFHCLKAYVSEVKGGEGFSQYFFFPFKNFYTFISLFCLKESLNAKPLRSNAISLDFSSVQLLSRVQLFAVLWTAAHQVSLSITNSWSLLKLMSIELVMPSNHLILCCSFLLLPPIPPSIRWPKHWSFRFSISPSNKYSEVISFQMNWLDLLEVQGTLKSPLQYRSSKASILQCSAFFTVQFSHPYMTTGKTIALTRQTFVGKEMSLLFNMLCRLVIVFLPGSKHLLISWLQSMNFTICSDFGAPQNKVCHCFHCFPIYFAMK